MAEFGAGFKVYADATEFERGMAKVQVAGEKVAKAFDAGNIAKGFLSGLGIGSALSLINMFGEAIKDASNHAEKLAQTFDSIGKSARSASEEIDKVGKSEARLLELAEQRLVRLKEKRDAMLNETGKKSFFGGIIERGSAFDKLFGFSRDDDVKRAEKIRDINKEITDTIVEQSKNTTAAKKEENKRVEENAKFNEEARATEKEIAAFTKERSREKLADQAKINSYKEEEVAITKQIADNEKYIRDLKGYKDADVLKETFGLKKQLADLQDKIKEVTEKTANAEKKVTEEIKKQLAEKNNLASIVGVRGVGQFGQASDAALQETIRRNQQQIQGFGPFTGIGQNMEIARLQAEIQNVKQELAFRSKLKADVNFFGVEGARSRFGGDPLAFDRLVQQYVDDARDLKKINAESNELLREMNQRQKSGLPVVNLNPGGG